MTNLIGGQLNPIIRATKFKRFYKKYEEEQRIEEGENSDINPNVFSSKGPVIGSDNTGTNLGHQSISLPSPEFQSGMILVDNALRMLSALQDERNLLAKAGLQIGANDDVRVIKDENGNLKGAMSICYAHMGQVIKIHYIDVESDSSNVNKSLAKLYLQQNSPLKFYKEAEMIKDEIDPNLIVK